MRRTVLAAGAAALAFGCSAAWADAEVNIPIAGSYRTQSDYGCGPVQLDPCDKTTQFAGWLSIDLPSTADGDYFGAGITFLVGGLDRAVSFTSPMDHAAEVVMRNGSVVSYFANGGDMGQRVFSAWYGGGVNSIQYDEVEPQSEFSVSAARVIPEPAPALMLALALGVGWIRGRQSLPWRR